MAYEVSGSWQRLLPDGLERGDGRVLLAATSRGSIVSVAWPKDPTAAGQPQQPLSGAPRTTDAAGMPVVQPQPQLQVQPQAAGGRPRGHMWEEGQTLRGPVSQCRLLAWGLTWPCRWAPGPPESHAATAAGLKSPGLGRPSSAGHPRIPCRTHLALWGLPLPPHHPPLLVTAAAAGRQNLAASCSNSTCFWTTMGLVRGPRLAPAGRVLQTPGLPAGGWCGGCWCGGAGSAAAVAGGGPGMKEYRLHASRITAMKVLHSAGVVFTGQVGTHQQLGPIRRAAGGACGASSSGLRARS